MTSPLRKLFQETSLDELCNQQNICILKDTASVEQALRVRNGLQHVLAMILLRQLHPERMPLPAGTPWCSVLCMFRIPRQLGVWQLL